ncbi:uncharacterized protein LOC125501167 [Athalia rosae]|uniref:uncharacterized protein LOC125501167 n=1 Tax=Athalia rosae TaxID=37344 RepID=UPI0020338720|nr:uncharacterized protein LOC125501167 [Athalia rosae]XP_048512310.1 uncharacterized protein LOC125501167 [Athalia rosae]XP_048512311.1 uncharacterized protein LOC125501167 [Athalia rosae]XP_048512313.1 uncharacterized protein LOC125501167 [Athalia rosae]XP_048512314.1 uncharacterized protein LOC125501167 [Athalia rosae]XP_048512315.1 uncharacterized protein LOC125501167 [Athalia rosae]
MFASERMLRRLGNSAEIYVDGTFKVVPNSPPIAQLYTIHMRVMDTGLAAVFVLCSAKTRALYTAIFRKILELAPEIEQNLRFAMGDYERAAMSALREVFPGASLHGCWFHFKQALLRRWRYLGLNAAPTRILGMAMALPLVPSERFEEGLNLLARLADHDAIEHPNVLQFLSYIRRQWGPLADIVSVHGCPIRTNNLVESFHNEARRKLGGLHPNIWKFIADDLTKNILSERLHGVNSLRYHILEPVEVCSSDSKLVSIPTGFMARRVCSPRMNSGHALLIISILSAICFDFCHFC